MILPGCVNPGRASRRLSLVVALAGMALLAGCETIPKEKCATLDWRQQGVEDGRFGYPASRIDLHRQACEGTAARIDVAAWDAGRRQGLVEYCRLPNAIDRGLARNDYHGVCPDPRFERLYTAARRLGDANHRIRDIDGQMDFRERELATNRKLSDERRAQYRSELRSLERNRESARDDRRRAERDLDRVRDELRI